jgi:acetyl esterase/lipase
VHLSVGTRELLLEQARRWRDKCVRAGVAVDYHEQRGGFHGYEVSAPFLPEARATLSRQAEFIGTKLAPAGEGAG